MPLKYMLVASAALLLVPPAVHADQSRCPNIAWIVAENANLDFGCYAGGFRNACGTVDVRSVPVNRDWTLGRCEGSEVDVKFGETHPRESVGVGVFHSFHCFLRRTREP